jgi:hypothetical protein
MPPGRPRVRCADSPRAAPSAAGSHRWRRPPGAPRAAHTPRTGRALLAAARATVGTGAAAPLGRAVADTAALARHPGLGGRQGKRCPSRNHPVQRLIGSFGRWGRMGAGSPCGPGPPQQLQLARSPGVADEVKGNSLGWRGQWHVMRSWRHATLAAAPERSVPPQAVRASTRSCAGAQGCRRSSASPPPALMTRPSPSPCWRRSSPSTGARPAWFVWTPPIGANT